MEKIVEILTSYKSYIYLILAILTLTGVIYTNKPPTVTPASAQPTVSVDEFQSLQRENRIDHARIERKIDSLLLIIVQRKVSP